MTPKRKEALQWFYDRGEVPSWRVRLRLERGGPTPNMLTILARDGLVIVNPETERVTLTDKGRRALNGDDV